MPTKGDPKGLNPTRYERDFLVQVWIDRRDLATICSYMDNHNMRPKYVADIIRFCVENQKALAAIHGATPVEKTGEANEYLKFRFGVDTNPGGKGKKAYLQNLILDSGFVPAFGNQEVTTGKISRSPISISDSGFTEEDIAAMKQRSREQFQGSDHLAKEREEKDSKEIDSQREAFESLIRKEEP